jgi:hypothetical protein
MQKTAYAILRCLVGSEMVYKRQVEIRQIVICEL